MDIRFYFKEKADMVNRQLDLILPSPDKKPQVLHEAMQYSVFAGGKRLRPVLFLATVESLEQSGELLLPFACSLELIHTYSLIHDDLPAMDNDDLRRGLPTCHKKFGEAQAILAGDALLTYAFNLMLMPKEKGVSPDRLLRAIEEIAFGAGIKGMIVGQVLDMEAEKKEISLEELHDIHSHKTGALLTAAVRSAAILAGEDSRIQELTGYAEQIGIAFQITDDILDLIGDEKKLGKPLGSDKKNEKVTYPSLLGLEKSRELAKQAVNQAIGYLKNMGVSAEPLREIARWIIYREN